MLVQLLLFLLDTAFGFFSLALLARFALQWARASFRNPIGQFVIAVTDWMHTQPESAPWPRMLAFLVHWKQWPPDSGDPVAPTYLIDRPLLLVVAGESRRLPAERLHALPSSGWRGAARIRCRQLSSALRRRAQDADADRCAGLDNRRRM